MTNVSYGEPEITCTVLNYINANVTTTVADADADFIDEPEQPFGNLKEVLVGKIDMAIHTYYVRGFWKQQTYPYYTDEVKIISLKESAKDNDIVINIFTFNVCLFLILSSAVCIIILKYTLEPSVSLAALEFLRMPVSHSTLKVPRKLYGKILLVTLIIISFLISTFLLSFLSAITTVTVYSPTIDSAADLINSNLSIYGIVSIKDLIPYERIRERFIAIDQFTECAKRLVKGDHIACLRELIC